MSVHHPILFIGGLGGSGTRAVAGALSALGFYPGGSLNGANDNLIFTELFKHPDWLRSGAPKSEIDARLGLFDKVMTRGIGLRALLAWPGLVRHLQHQWRGLAGAGPAAGWMTKEPNCHIFLEAILEHWPQAVFVYVTRHPLDMAFSNNKAQMSNWGWMFDLDPESFGSPEAAQLEYWIRTQRRLDRLRETFGTRLYPLNFDRFAGDPVNELTALVDALSLPVDRTRLPEACSGVVRPETTGRWRSQGLSRFSADQLAFCESAGWSVDPNDRV